MGSMSMNPLSAPAARALRTILATLRWLDTAAPTHAGEPVINTPHERRPVDPLSLGCEPAPLFPGLAPARGGRSRRASHHPSAVTIAPSPTGAAYWSARTSGPNGADTAGSSRIISPAT